jgi:hypothetical protein
MMKKNRIIIYVSGGCVQGVNADNGKNLDVLLFDVDNLKAEGKTGEQIVKEFDILAKGTEVIF